MNYYSFNKTTLWLNIVGALVSYVLFAVELYTSAAQHTSYTSSLVFIFLAVNCTFRIFSWYRINRKKKSGLSEEALAKEERRQGMIDSIFSNATGVLVMLALTVHFIIRNTPVAFIVFCAVCTLCFVGILVLSIQNLKRIDRQ